MINIKKTLLKIIVFTFLFSIVFFNVNCVQAQEPLLKNDGATKYSSEKCMKDGDCELNDLLIVLIRSSEILLGVVGSLALLAFVIGGVFMLISAGNKEMVARGRKIIIGAVIGLVIVFLSYGITKFVLDSMGVSGWDRKSNFDPTGASPATSNTPPAN